MVKLPLPFDLHCGNRLMLEMALTSKITVALPTDLRYGNDIENASGTRADRPELVRLLADSHPGDVLLVESIDRLSRLPAEDWSKLKAAIDGKGLRIVALDLPTSHQSMGMSGRSTVAFLYA